MLKRRVEKLNERIDDLGAIVANVTSEIDQVREQPAFMLSNL